jgi:hypothetical protein
MDHNILVTHLSYSPFFFRSLDILTVAKLTLLFVTVLLMVKQHLRFWLFFLMVQYCSLPYFMMCYFAVTGLHDMDEFVQSQLILAVNSGSS